MNVSKTPGVIKEIRGELFLGSDLPKRPTFTYSAVLTAELIAREGQQTDLMTFPFNRNLTLDEIDAIGVGHSQFCFFGYMNMPTLFSACTRKDLPSGFAFIPATMPNPLAGENTITASPKRYPVDIIRRFVKTALRRPVWTET